MAANREQEEQEAPAKVYQLKAVESKVDDISKKIDTLIRQTAGVVTSAQLELRIKDYDKEVESKIKDAVKKIHLEYGPTKKGALWVLGVLVAAVITQLVINMWNLIQAKP